MSNQNMMSKVATPYAEALLDLAQNYNLLPKTNEDLSIISNMLSNSIDLQASLSNPLISVLVKKNILETLFKDQINDFVLNFLLVLVDRRRIFLLSTIIEKYLELAYQVESIVLVSLSTAISITEIQQNAIVEKIKEMTNSKNVKLIMKINPDLIGGFILKIGSKVIDTSLAGKLKQMSFYLNQA
uniref:ATP synthase CF1 subunit delta n=1 Tax=Sphondylothamnion multifidum TaxID=193186 RepID=A0A4D6X1K8_9FLOR|nr:ATP synthase CF1 subunit delta [Sphondylothamnion multifidum]